VRKRPCLCSYGVLLSRGSCFWNCKTTWSKQYIYRGGSFLFFYSFISRLINTLPYSIQLNTGSAPIYGENCGSSSRPSLSRSYSLRYQARQCLLHQERSMHNWVFSNCVAQAWGGGLYIELFWELIILASVFLQDIKFLEFFLFFE
jgi:hypothetical protein